MIIGIGTDCIKISRIKKIIDKYGDTFINRIFTPPEQQHNASINHYAKRFAGKEAVLKAIGTGLRQGMKWHDINITNNKLGKPQVSLSGNIKAMLPHNALVHISLSDDGDMALAFVVIEHSEKQHANSHH